ncbi:MAG TPA: hypothetical protein VFG69_18905 [Nannocystaceae bacterium]|nr:hypothetical protein [Nannocystaceae bacterium]
MLVLFALALATGPTSTGERPLVDAIAVDGTAQCLERERLAVHVAGWLGSDRLDARLDVVAREADDRVEFVLRRDESVRVERAIAPAPRDCADRQAALGLAIALAIDASVLESIAPAPTPVAPTPAAAPTPTRAPTPIVEPERVAAEPAPRPRELRVALLFGPVALVEVLDHAAFGGELGVELRPIEFLDVRVGALVAGGLPIGLAGGEIAPVLAGGRADACPARSFARERLRLRVCLGLAAAVATARGRDFQANRRPLLPWAAALAGGEAEVRLADRVGLRAHAGLVAPFVRASFVVRDTANVVVARSDTPPVGAALGLGLSVRLR